MRRFLEGLVPWDDIEWRFAVGILGLLITVIAIFVFNAPLHGWGTPGFWDWP